MTDRASARWRQTVRAARRTLRLTVQRLTVQRLTVPPLAARWRTPAAAPPGDVLALDSVRRRLEFLLAGLHGRSLRIDAVPPAPTRSLAWRATYALARRALPHRVPDHTLLDVLPGALGATIQLPPTVAGDATVDAAARYRVLALVQAERLARDAAAHCPGEGDPVARACYLLCEGAATDRAVARRVRGVLPVLHALRAEALASRPPVADLPPIARDVEQLIREALAPGALHLGVAPAAEDDGPVAARAWALATEARLLGRIAAGPQVLGRVARYLTGLPPVLHWGRAPEPPSDGFGELVAAMPLISRGNPDDRRRFRPDPSTGPARARAADEFELPDRTALVRGDSQTQRVVEDGRGALSQVRSTQGEDGLVHARDAPMELRPSLGAPPVPDAPVHEPPRALRDRRPAERPAAELTYPEWDTRTGRHRPHAVTVLLDVAPEGDAAWADAVLRDHAALVRRVRHRFEPLRAQRARLPRQRQGDALDLAACVEGLVDRAAGRPGDDRLYVAARPARRALAIALLVDVSGSTDARIGTARDDLRQIIDVEKEAVLLAGEALDALGDPFTVLTFSSRGAHAVRLHTVKGFAERHDAVVRRRVAAMRPAGNTRLGAAVRHASALLARQPAGHRLLLLLSDGRPNDMDGYQGRYAVEDARQAVHEARAQGVFPFCLTVDREESEYLGHIFGAAGHTILRRPDQLPIALVNAVRQLLGAGR